MFCAFGGTSLYWLPLEGRALLEDRVLCFCVFVVLGIKSRASGMLGTCSATELHLQPQVLCFKHHWSAEGRVLSEAKV
jgi:hypothetical protein